MVLPRVSPTAAADMSDFDRDVRNLHITYDYKAKNVKTGAPEMWRYECWFFSESRLVYKIHGGPYAGRLNFQTATYQCIRPGELWQCNWLEDTGTVCSLVYDLPNNSVTALLSFSQGHFEHPDDAKGDKRIAADLDRWRGLAKIGKQTDRFMMSIKADIVDTFRGAGLLEPITGDEETF